MKNFIIAIITCSILWFESNGEFFKPIVPCYAVSGNNGSPNVLFKYDPIEEKWNQVGITGVSSIDAIAINHHTEIIYAINGGVFGTINPSNGVFSAIGSVGTGQGSLGNQIFDDIDGLTYDSVNFLMYGTQRRWGIGPGTNDLLFQIDISTGQVVPDAMQDSDGNSVDYAVIKSVFSNASGSELYDVDDIAYNTYSGKIFAIQNQDLFGVITELNPVNGKIERVLFDLAVNDIEGLTFNNFGHLYATTGDASTLEESNSFFNIDLYNGATTNLGQIDFNQIGQVDFEACACQFVKTDLALKMILSQNNTITSVNPGDLVTFLITVYNQGSIENRDILISNYVSDGLILNDPSWNDSGNSIAWTIIPGPLAIGDSISISITLQVDFNLLSNHLINAAEITYSFGTDIVDLLGNPISLPDNDSQPDNLNNEINIVDNEINQGGLYANEDEDDHDIATINIITGSIADVYPGDLNHDGIVNNQDVGWSGAYFGEVGPTRVAEHQNTDWYAHPAEDWGTEQLNNEDIKHFDCNGDGSVDYKDRQAVEDNMGEMWTTPTPPIPPDESDYQVVLHPIEIENNFLRINVALESTDNTDMVLQGGHFTIDYGDQNPNILNATMNFSSLSWLGALNLNLIDHVQNFPATQTVEVGFTRIDGIDAVGNGVIGELILQLDNSVARTAKQNNCILQIAVNTIGMHDSQPTIQPVEDQLLPINLCESTCKNTWHIDSNTQFQNAYESIDSIVTEGFLIIGDEQQVEYRSDNVYLKSGFEVKVGANFEAGHGNCD